MFASWNQLNQSSMNESIFDNDQTIGTGLWNQDINHGLLAIEGGKNT